MRALSHSKPPRAHLVVESHASLHAIGELTNEQIAFFGTSKTQSTVRRMARSTESSALIRCIKQTYHGIRFFRVNFCSRRITNITSVVERFGRELLCPSGRMASFHRCGTYAPLRIQMTIPSSLCRRAGSTLR